LIESAWFQARFGHRFRLASDQNVKGYFRNSEQGEMFATSTRGSVTGFGGDRILIDDPHSAEDQDNEEQIKRDVEALRSATLNRLNDPESGAIVVVGHRLHECDLSAWLLAHQPGRWTHLALTAQAEGYECFTGPITGRKFERESGEALHAVRFSMESLKEAKTALGARRYALNSSNGRRRSKAASLSADGCASGGTMSVGRKSFPPIEPRRMLRQKRAWASACPWPTCKSNPGTWPSRTRQRAPTL
jgi:hypothetical protein